MFSQRGLRVFISVGFFVLGVLAFKHFYGFEHKSAVASLMQEDEFKASVNYAPSHKRHLRVLLDRDAQHILDFKGQDVLQIFDTPELVRRETPTTIWQYRNEQCVMDVFFTVGDSVDVSDVIVAHYEVRGRDSSLEKTIGAVECMHALAVHDFSLSLFDIGALYKAR